MEKLHILFQLLPSDAITVQEGTEEGPVTQINPRNITESSPPEQTFNIGWPWISQSPMWWAPVFYFCKLTNFPIQFLLTGSF